MIADSGWIAFLNDTTIRIATYRRLILPGSPTEHFQNLCATRRYGARGSELLIARSGIEWDTAVVSKGRLDVRFRENGGSLGTWSYLQGAESHQDCPPPATALSNRR